MIGPGLWHMCINRILIYLNNRTDVKICLNNSKCSACKQAWEKVSVFAQENTQNRNTNHGRKQQQALAEPTDPEAEPPPSQQELQLGFVLLVTVCGAASLSQSVNLCAAALTLNWSRVFLPRTLEPAERKTQTLWKKLAASSAPPSGSPSTQPAVCAARCN